MPHHTQKLNMGEEAITNDFKHLVIVKFKQDVAVQDIIKGMENLVSQIDSVKSFEWSANLIHNTTYFNIVSYIIYHNLNLILCIDYSTGVKMWKGKRC